LQECFSDVLCIAKQTHHPVDSPALSFDYFSSKLCDYCLYLQRPPTGPTRDNILHQHN